MRMGSLSRLNLAGYVTRLTKSTNEFLENWLLISRGRLGPLWKNQTWMKTELVGGLATFLSQASLMNAQFGVLRVNHRMNQNASQDSAESRDAFVGLPVEIFGY